MSELGVALEDQQGLNESFLTFKANDLVEIIRWNVDIVKSLAPKDLEGIVHILSPATSSSSGKESPWAEGVNTRTGQQGYFRISKIGKFRQSDSPILGEETLSPTVKN
ncbi:hypothetical protein HK098_001681 [Nowakowskiella sp. JEL0407]|nr:hypothetical protein HK098_001681 [Nowakowskiella sp. JEL0407]